MNLMFMAGYHRIGEMLIAKGLISKDQLADAIDDRQGSAFRIGEILVAKGLITDDDVLDCLAEQYHFPVADLTRTRPSFHALSLLDIEIWNSRPMLPICLRGKTLVCAVPDPFDTAFHELLREQFGVSLEFVLARPEDIRAALLECSIVVRNQGSGASS